MTEGEEKELVIVKTAIQTAYADKLERDLAIGAGLPQDFPPQALPEQGRRQALGQWLADESHADMAITAVWRSRPLNTSEAFTSFVASC